MAIHPDQVDLGDISVKSLFICPVGVGVGSPVYQTGAGTVDRADASDKTKMPTNGIVASKPTTTSCYVVSQGSVNKASWGLTPKDTYFVGTGGAIVKAPGVPQTSGSVIQEVGYSKDADTLFVVLDRDYTTIE